MAQPTIEQAFDSALRHFNAGERRQAATEFQYVLTLEPRHARALHFLGIIAGEECRFEDAEKLIRQAIDCDPSLAGAYNNLGSTLHATGRPAEAVALYRQFIALRPDNAIGHDNLGTSFMHCGEVEQAVLAYRRALELRNDVSDYHLHLGSALATSGDLKAAWEEFEHRPVLSFAVAKTQWKGEDLHGGTLLIYGEQGFGDSIQFIRYLPLVLERHRKVILLCPPELRRLFAGLCPTFDHDRSLPPFDQQCSLMSLPRVFGTDLTNVPNQVPYLRADQRDVAWWRRRIGSDGGKIKVGLAWAGNSKHVNDFHRSIALKMLAPLAQVSTARFYSLQKDEPGRSQPRPQGMEIIDCMGSIADIADSAAMITNLDLVISVDSAIAHLAGALGKPVWALLSAASDWRFLKNRQDCVWYPTMRLFRQPSLGDWDSVVRSVAMELHALAAQHKS